MRNFGSHIFAPLPLHVSELASASLSLSKSLPSTSSHEAVPDWPAGSPHIELGPPIGGFVSAGFATDALIGWDGGGGAGGVLAYIRRLPLVTVLFTLSRSPVRN